jgi:hypothetical protein
MSLTIFYTFYTHNIAYKLARGSSIDIPYNLLYFLHAQRRVQKQGATNRCTSLFLLLAAHTSPRTKKQGASDRCYIQLLLLSARATPRTKSKGLSRYVLQI